MAQQLKALKDPSIVKNVPVTALEALQQALEAKAARIASGEEKLTSTSAPSGLTTRPVTTVPIDSNGNPILSAIPGYGFTGPSSAETRGEQSGTRRAITLGTQPAGTVAMPPGARPASVDRAFQKMGIVAPAPLVAPVNDPFRTFNPNADQSRLPQGMPNGPNDPASVAFMNNFYPDAAPQPSALSAITSAMAPRMMPGRPASLSATPQQAAQILRRGTQGANVGNIQNLLAQGGYNVGSVDGIFGPKTQAAVTAFQRANGLTPDGIIGSKTMAALNNPSSVAAALVPRQTAVAAPVAAKPRANNAVAAALAKPSGYGSKGVSKAGQELRNAFAYAM